MKGIDRCRKHARVHLAGRVCSQCADEMDPPRPTMPADVRTLAEEAIGLARKATPGPWKSDAARGGDTVVVVADGLYGIDLTFTLAEADNDEEHESKRNADLIAHAGTHYATIAKALIEVMDDRDALLADLPHALGRCGCIHFEETRDGNSIVISGGWTKEHHAALDRLEARIE